MSQDFFSDERLIERVIRLRGLLRDNKKIGFKHRRNHVSDGKVSQILYFWSNPQFNVIFCMLEDGRTVPYELGFMDIFWNDFKEYIPTEPEPTSLTVKEVEEKLGYKIRIVSEEDNQ